MIKYESAQKDLQLLEQQQAIQQQELKKSETIDLVYYNSGNCFTNSWNFILSFQKKSSNSQAGLIGTKFS